MLRFSVYEDMLCEYTILGGIKIHNVSVKPPLLPICFDPALFSHAVLKWNLSLQSSSFACRMWTYVCSRYDLLPINLLSLSLAHMYSRHRSLSSFLAFFGNLPCRSRRTGACIFQGLETQQILHPGQTTRGWVIVCDAFELLSNVFGLSSVYSKTVEQSDLLRIAATYINHCG